MSKGESFTKKDSKFKKGQYKTMHVRGNAGVENKVMVCRLPKQTRFTFFIIYPIPKKMNFL